MRDGKNMLGRDLDKIRFDGTSNTTYVTKNTINTKEYWFEVRSRSTSIPATFAFPMLGEVRFSQIRKRL